MAAYESVTVEFELGEWTDVTERVDGTYNIAQGDTPEASADPGGLSLPVRNHDQWATPGNPVSPLAPYLKPGMRCRIKDAPADQVTPLFTGYLAYPEALSWTESNADNPREQIVHLPFVDLISYVDDSRTLAAAYTEYVIHNGRGDLKGFWPLTQERAPFLGIGPETLPMTISNSTSGTVNPGARPTPQGGEAPPALEAAGLRAGYILDPSTGSEAYNRVLTPDTFIPAIAPGDTVTAVFWMNHVTAATALFQQLAGFVIIGSSSTVDVSLVRDVSTGVWTLSAGGAQAASITAGPVGLDALLPVAIRYCPDPAVMELWVGSVRLTATPTGTPPADMTLDGPDFGFQFGSYDLSGVGVYIGQTWGYDDYLALIEQAYAPLEGQTTGQRIKTALEWAGVDVPMHRINNGTSVMQAAVTANRKAPDLINDAVQTEQGEYYADGEGQPVFDDRTTLYNV